MDKVNGLVVVTGALACLVVLAGLLYWSRQRSASRGEMAQRIAAARVRSGHVPIEIPALRGRLDTGDTVPGPFDTDARVVDEQPCILIRLLDAQGHMIERKVQVELLDLRRQVLLARGGPTEPVQTYPLDRIRQARLSDSDSPFDLRTWVEAVRAARRRRAAQPAPPESA